MSQVLVTSAAGVDLPTGFDRTGAWWLCVSYDNGTTFVAQTAAAAVLVVLRTCAHARRA